MSEAGDNWRAEMRAKAREAADHLLGTCEALYVHFEEYQDDETFCATLDEHVRCCETCDWWVEAGDVDEDGNCEDCAEPES